MSNTFRSGPITAPAASAVAKGRLVALGADGVSHADADGGVFGAVVNAAAPAAPRDSNDLSLGLPEIIAVHSAPATVNLETEDTFDLGAPVFAGADGLAAAAGPVQVGVAVAASDGARVRTRLTTPAAASA